MRIFTIAILILTTFFHAQGQKQQGTLYFSNGTVLEGLVKLKGTEKLKFKKNKKDKSTIYFWKDISKVTIFESGNGKFHFFNLNVKDKDKSIVLQQVYEGKIDLFKEVTVIHNYNIMMSDSNLTPSYSGKTEQVHFYLKKKDDTEVFQINLDKSFKNVALNLFADCDKVVNKINEKIYTKKNIQDIVFEYNYKCN